MENSERQIALVKVKETGVFSNADYDLYVTNGRMVFIHTKSTKNWGLLGGLAGAAVQTALESRKKRSNGQSDKAELDELLKSNKKNFELTYDDIEKVKLYKVLRNRHLEIYLKKLNVDLHAKSLEFGWLSEEHFEKLSAVLPTVSMLKGKIER
jgi:hypothetical protein